MNIYNLCLEVLLNRSNSYCLGSLFDLSQSLGLNIFLEIDYISLISTADRVRFNLILFYSSLPIRFTSHRLNIERYVIGSTPDRLSFVNLTVFLFLVGYRIKPTGTPLNLKERFRTCTEVKQISQGSMCFSHQQRAAVRWLHPVPWARTARLDCWCDVDWLSQDWR
jgi:hypothetical protein